MKTPRLLLLLARSNAVVNGDFSKGAGIGWSTPVAGASITGGALAFDGATSISNGAIVTTGTATPAIVAGLSYRVTHTIVADTTIAISVNVGGTLGTGRNVPGTYTETLVATNSNGPQVMARFGTGARTGSIDNIIVRRA